MDKQGITIASDSRRITIALQEIKASDGFEKVIPLGSKLAFMSSGLTEIAIGTSDVRPAQLARKAYTELLRRDENFSVKDLAVSFGRLTTKQLDGMSCSQKIRVASLLRRVLGAQDDEVMEAMIAGLEDDGSFKVETVDFYLSPRVIETLEGFQFDWTLHEAIADDSPRVILSGEIGVLQGRPPEWRTAHRLPAFVCCVVAGVTPRQAARCCRHGRGITEPGYQVFAG